MSERVEFHWDMYTFRMKLVFRKEYIRQAKLNPNFKSGMSRYVESGTFQADVALLKRVHHDDSWELALALAAAGGLERIMERVVMGYIHRRRHCWLIF